MKPAISVHNLSKEYRLGLASTKGNNLTENLRVQARNIWDKVSRLVSPTKGYTKEESFWALKDVSFEVQPGEVVGIIGRNGAGKSTLLKVLSQIVEPTSGHAEVRGRMGSLLEVGTGFHPELTGRENIFMNGAILGMKRVEITRKFDEIVAFAEVEKFLDTPVKRYSSGMYVRLAFAVAAHLEPEILIVDEVLAVGDIGFQKKCLSKMREAGSNGKSILFVSHNLNAVSSLCNRAIVLQNGKVSLTGSVKDALGCYNNQISHNPVVDLSLHENSSGSVNGTIKQIAMFDDTKQPSATFAPESEVIFELILNTSNRINEPTIGIGINNSVGERVCAVASYLSAYTPVPITGLCNVTTRFRLPALVPGLYFLDLSLSEKTGPFIHAIYSACAFEVPETNYLNTSKSLFSAAGYVMVRSQWDIVSKDIL